jgi:uncharacterized protein (DUF305 family)
MTHGTISFHYYIPLFLCFIASLFLYRKQVAINETDYLKEMIEHHDMALFTSENILNKPNISQRVREFAIKILNTQTKEIAEMNQLIQNEKK